MKRLKQILWLATTPLALTLLLATGQAQEHESAPTGGEPVAHEEGEEFVTNPVQNFSDFGYHSKDAHGAKYDPDSATAHKMPPPFSMALVNFAILLFLVGKTAGPGVKKYVRDRHDTIAKDLAEGARLRDQAQQKLKEYSAKLAGLEQEIALLTGQIRAEAETEKKRIITEAEARAERMRRDAELQIQAEIERARQSVEREAVEAAISVAERILRDKTTDADQKKLAESFVKNLETAAAARPQKVPS